MAVAGLKGGFWLQHGSTERTALMSIAADLAQQTGSRPGISLGPVNAPNTLNPLFKAARRLGDAVLDPHGHLIDNDPTQRARNHFPWLAQTRPTTAAGWQQWIQTALNHQQSTALRGTGNPPSYLVTACPRLTLAGGTAELYSVIDAALAVHAALPLGTDCWLGLTVERDYVREQPHLTTLANTMVAATVDGIVFRAQQRELVPVMDRRYLAGLREIVEAAASNGFRIFLPGSGWLGWLAMAWGAWGFSGGMAAGTWVDRIPSAITRPSEPANPYYEPQLLRPVRWRVHQQLATDPTYVACTCVDCQAMAGTYDAVLAKRHQIRHAHEETTSLLALTPAQRRRHVADRLDDAMAFRDNLGSDQVRDRAGAEFLDRWRQLV